MSINFLQAISKKEVRKIEKEYDDWWKSLEFNDKSNIHRLLGPKKYTVCEHCDKITEVKSV